MGAGKHSSEESVFFDFSFLGNIKKSFSFIKVLVIFTILFVLVGGGFAIKIFLDNKNTSIQQPGGTEQVSAVIPALETHYEGYEVLGKIKIEKLNVEQYILNSSDDSALKKGVTKLYGGELNDYGNFCISGHNYENVFQRLNELEIGDCFTIIDKDLSEAEYQIKEIISVEPDDLTPLIPNKDTIQITLITCENIGTTRLVVKAEKV